MSGGQTFGTCRDRVVESSGEGRTGLPPEPCDRIPPYAEAVLGELKCPVRLAPDTRTQFSVPAQASTLNDVLSKETIKTLGETSQEYYRIRAFVKKVDGELRTVVLAGESHLKDAQAFGQGEKLTKCFQYSALEGLNRPEYWADKMVTLFVNGLVLLDQASGDNKLACDSTLQVALDTATLSELKERYAKILAAIIQRHGLSLDKREEWNEVGKIDFGGHQLSIAELEEKRWEIRSCHLLGADVVRLGFEMATSPQAERRSAPSFSVFSLEKDHQKTLAEEIGMAYLPALAMTSAVTLTFLAAKVGQLGLVNGPLTATVGWISTAFTAAAVVLHTGMELLRGVLYDRPWFPYLSSGPLGALVTGRNSTFVSSINSIMKSHTEVDKLLVIVGRDHVVGVSAALVKEHGWRELDVPGQRVGY